MADWKKRSINELTSKIVCSIFSENIDNFLASKSSYFAGKYKKSRISQEFLPNSRKIVWAFKLGTKQLKNHTFQRFRNALSQRFSNKFAKDFERCLGLLFLALKFTTKQLKDQLFKNFPTSFKVIRVSKLSS